MRLAALTWLRHLQLPCMLLLAVGHWLPSLLPLPSHRIKVRRLPLLAHPPIVETIVPPPLAPTRERPGCRWPCEWSVVGGGGGGLAVGSGMAARHLGTEGGEWVDWRVWKDVLVQLRAKGGVRYQRDAMQGGRASW